MKLGKNNIEIKHFDSFLTKLKGLMLKKNINYGIRLKCNGIHTFFMRMSIDVFLTDKNNKVLFVYKNFKPNRIILPKKGVYYTYEFPVSTVSFEVNEKIDV